MFRSWLRKPEQPWPKVSEKPVDRNNVDGRARPRQCPANMAHCQCGNGKTRTAARFVAVLRLLPGGLLGGRRLGFSGLCGARSSRRENVGGHRRFAKPAAPGVGRCPGGRREIRAALARPANPGIREPRLPGQSEQSLLFLQARVVHRIGAAGPRRSFRRDRLWRKRQRRRRSSSGRTGGGRVQGPRSP